jgi:hypothetical protein
MAALERIPAIEAPADERESPETVEEAPEGETRRARVRQGLRRAYRGPGGVGCSEDEREGPWDVEAHARANRKASRAIRGGT